MDSFGNLFCNNIQSFTAKVAIGKGVNFQIGSRWSSAFSIDPQFEIHHFTSGQSEALDDLNLGTGYFFSVTRSDA